jgi:phage FluMu protein gp41
MEEFEFKVKYACLGYLQRQIVELGKIKGIINVGEIRQFYKEDIKLNMNKLIFQGFFKEKIDAYGNVAYEYIGEK